MDYPGVGKIKQVAFPAKFSQTPADIRTSPSSPGQDTDEILQTLGYSLEEIADFRQIGVI
jgi:formyl-CoA transferase